MGVVLTGGVVGENGADADHGPQGGSKNIVGDEVAQLALDEDEANRQPVEVEAEPETRQRGMPQVTKVRLRPLFGCSNRRIHVARLS